MKFLEGGVQKGAETITGMPTSLDDGEPGAQAKFMLPGLDGVRVEVEDS